MPITPTLVQNGNGFVRVLKYDGTVTMLKNADKADNLGFTFLPVDDFVSVLVDFGKRAKLASITVDEELTVSDLRTLRDQVTRAQIEDLTVAKLRTLCDHYSIKINTKLRKAELVELVFGR